MQSWFESVAGPNYASALMWTLLALLVLVIVLVIVRLVRGLTFGTFVAGGRNRKARLAVMDATAVDSQRRLVLVRRDDIEHLILIGGATDIVVEQNIRLLPPSRRSAAEETAAPAPRPAQEPAAQPQPARPAAAVSAAPAGYAPRPAAPQPRPPAAPVDVQPKAAPAPVRPVPPAAVAAPAVDPAAPVRTLRPVVPPVVASPAIAPAPGASPQPKPRPDLDSALLEELEVSLEREQRAGGARDADASLDEEMSRLLSDLSGQKP